MSDSGPVIPFDRLPKGFARRLDVPGPPAPPRPAATVVLLREGEGALEALLVRRTRSAGFVPGAFVFPGGRVDGSDGRRAAADRLAGWDPGGLARRLGLDAAGEEDQDCPSAAAFVVAAIREVFEETGILIAVSRAGTPLPSATQDPDVEAARRTLLEGASDFPEVLASMDAWMDGGALGYIAHWITPEAEPRRYDTRFFAAQVPRGTDVLVDDREITEGVWLPPAVALARNREGDLPMVFPTLKTLEALEPFSTPAQVLDHYRHREIPAVLPRFVRTPTGVGIQIPDS